MFKPIRLSVISACQVNKIASSVFGASQQRAGGPAREALGSRRRRRPLLPPMITMLTEGGFSESLGIFGGPPLAHIEAEFTPESCDHPFKH